MEWVHYYFGYSLAEILQRATARGWGSVGRFILFARIKFVFGRRLFLLAFELLCRTELSTTAETLIINIRLEQTPKMNYEGVLQ